MGRMIVESWLGRVGLIRVGGGGRRSTSSKDTAAAGPPDKLRIGVLSFEVAGLMSKAAHLWHSLSDDQVARLRDDILHLPGVRKLVSDDDAFLLGLALTEMLDALAFVARSVSRLGSRCSDPVLKHLENVFPDLVASAGSADADPCGWLFPGRKMERKVRKMERLAAASTNLYQEMEVLAELEQGLRRMQGNATSTDQGNLVDFRQKVAWQRQEVKRLREVALWNRSYDYAIRLLARSLFTIIWRIQHVFGLLRLMAAVDGVGADLRFPSRLPRSHSVSGLVRPSVHPSHANGAARFSSGPLERSRTRSGPISGAKSGPIADPNRIMGGQSLPHSRLPPLPGKHPGAKTKWSVSGGPFRGCMVGGKDSPVLQSCIPTDSGFRRSNAVSKTNPESHFLGNVPTTGLSLSIFETKRKLLNAPPPTLGAAALALHYANVIVIIEKLVVSPHLIGPDARDDLYSMLPTSVRAALRARLKSYAKNLASSVYDPVLAAEWSEALTRILEWLAPLAHNMIRWQSERNYEQQHLVSKTNVLLLQTLYFANQAKTEAAITELLVGLNYLWRFGRELNAKAILECTSSRNLDNCFNSKG